MKVICNCGQQYLTTARNFKRNKFNGCPACMKAMRVLLIAEAAKKKKKFEAPDERYCKSCFVVKPYKEFPKGRHTCKKCHNVGRSAYYHSKFI